MRTVTGAEWSWANVVLMKSSRSLPEAKVSRNLSTCPDNSMAGQVDRLFPTFRSSPAAVPDVILHIADSRRATAPPCKNNDEDCTAVAQQCEASRRAWAESCTRLNPDRPPGDVPLRRWHQLIADIGDFVDGGWAEKAAVLGWTLGDLVGADRERPFARLDRAGLLWLLNGKRLIAICENTATIETRTGARQTYRRKPNEPGRLLAWELVR
jgi:hypothetical protein